MHLKTYEPGDEDAIVALWNRHVRGCFATGPITKEIFLADVVGKRYFDPHGLIIAFEGKCPVAFAHAGFLSSDWVKPNPINGTVSLIAADPAYLDAGVQVVNAAVRYLFREGARQVDAFTIDFPNTPFYNGLYGGEKAGMDEDHPLGLEILGRCRFRISSGNVVMVCELPDRAKLPAPPAGLELKVGPWKNVVAEQPPTECYGIPEKIRRALLVDGSGAEKVGITFWHLDRYNQATGDRMAVVSHVGCAQELQGTGAAEFLQRSVHRIMHEEGARQVGLGTGGRSGRAVGFYKKAGYRPLKVAYTFFLDWRSHGGFR
jgi:GNAT superfamily N-acetyltransferase